MGNKQIDILFEEYKNDNLEYLWYCANIQGEFSREKVLKDKIIKGQIFGNLYENLFKNDISSLLSKLKSNERSDYNLALLLLGYSDDAVIDECIERREEFGFDKIEIINLLTTRTHVPEYIDKYIKEKKEFGFSKNDIIRLICNVNNPEYTDIYISRREEFRFSNQEIVRLIFEMRNLEYTDKWIKRREELGLTNWNIVRLISETENPEYIESFIKRKDEFEFDKNSIVRLICSIKKSERINEYIERREEFGFDKNDIINLIFSMDTPQFISKYIERKEDFGWDNNDIFMLEVLSGNIDFLDQFIENSETAINLPTSITIGIEIESFGTMPKERLKKLIIDNWECKEDESLISNSLKEQGTEIVSPSKHLLTGDNIETTQRIQRICKILTTFGQHVNEKCGGHVHIGADYLTSVQAWHNLIELWTNSEKILYIISNTEGELPRNSIKAHSIPISKGFQNKMKDGRLTLKKEADLKAIRIELCNAQSNRNKGINFKNLSEYGKHTIEFRLSNGTVDAKTWIENINLYGGLVRAAEDLSIIQQKVESDCTEEEQHILECFENIRSKKFGEKETLEQLLQIVIPEENRECYRRRYETNVKLLQSNPELEDEIRNHIAVESIILDKYDLVGSVFTEDNRITSAEVENTTKAIDGDLNRMQGINFLENMK